jgi:DNA processing protein
MAAFGSADAVLGKSAAQLSGAVAGLSAQQAQALLAFTAAFDGQAELELAQRQGVRILRFDQAGYPARLRSLPVPPPLLYIKGELPPDDALCVAIVGTRQATDYGLRQARSIAQGLVKAGVWIVSGLALGIDAAAHEACLEAGGRTLAVQGRGLSEIYPAANKVLGGRIPAQGALISQFSLQAAPLKHHFPMRNALISGLSQGVVVVEGERDSGSLITADRALEQGREVFAVPGPADAPYSQGPLDLIENGARLVRHADDILKELGLKVEPRGRASRTVDAAVTAPSGGAPAWQAPLLPEDSDEAKVLAALQAKPQSGLDELGQLSGMEAGRLSVALLQLELLGAVRQKPGARVELRA